MRVDVRTALRVVFAAGVLAVAVFVIFRPLEAPRAQQPAAQPAPDTAAFTAPAINDTTALNGPRQPIFFRHDVHAGQYKLDCKYCHYSAEYAMWPGIPSVKTCMGCHLIAGAAIPEVQKLRQIALSNQAVEWSAVYHLPPFVHFPHMRHVKGPTAVKAGLKCQTCHGPVERMAQVYEYPPLKMGWCLDCHLKNKVSTDCTACHF
jgi:hypothetical protein